jgi:hypothetical protein
LAGSYALTGTISSGPPLNCQSAGTVNINVHPLPVAQPITTNPNPYCPIPNPLVTLTACATGGTVMGSSPVPVGFYSFLWNTGYLATDPNCVNYTVSIPGNYSYTVTDQLGCKSNNLASYYVMPPPDFTGLLTGCFRACDNMLLCPPNIDPNYPITAWYYNGALFAPGNTNLTVTNSGTYTYEMCDATGNCCQVSAPIDITISIGGNNCDQCCKGNIPKIYNMQCIGPDLNGSMQYSFQLDFYLNCPDPAQFYISDANGSVSNITLTTLLPGNNTIYGTYTVTNSGTTDFCPDMSLYTYNPKSGQWEASCTEISVPCYTLPACSGATPCNFGFTLAGEKCLGYISSIPCYQYSFQFSINNSFSYPLNYTLTSSQGNFTSAGSGTLNSGMNTLVTLFNDNLAFDGYFCVLLTVTDPSTGMPICEEWVCFPASPCTHQNCVIDAKVISISCNGTDANGNPQYLIDMLMSNMFGGSASTSLSFLSPNGIISSISPATLLPGALGVPVQFVFTDLSGSGMICFSIQQTNVNTGQFCFMDYNSNSNFCLNLPGCPKPAKSNSNTTLLATSNEKPSNIGSQLKIQPNPSNGSAIIYYKIGLDRSCIDCKVRIMETGSGRIVCEKKLELPVGTISIKDCNLAEGHYIVTLWNADKLINNEKMEVVK